MKTFVTSSLYVLLVLQGSAQTISGFVKDSVTKVSVVFATVSLRRVAGDTDILSTVTNDKGRFRLSNSLTGPAEIRLTSVGYTPLKVLVTIQEGGKMTDLGTLLLSPRSELLKEVVIDSKKVLVEEQLDRTVYNVDRDKSLTGGDAIDALRRVPLLSVDIDGNVMLRGSANIKVLINGKPSTITANNLADALKQIPADQIKSVEVITSPSVKYDADGSAGIVNIVLKQDRLHGVLLSPDFAIGTRASFLGINGAYNNKKMAFSVGGFGRATYNVTGNYNNAQTAGPDAIDQHASTRKNELTDNYNLGWDYEVDKKDFINASVRYSQLNNHNRQDDLFTQFYQASVLDSIQLSQVEVTGKSGTVDAAIDYTHTFGRPQQEFSLMTLLSRTDGSSGFSNRQERPADDSLINRVTNDDRNSNQEVTIQADYQTPLDSGQLLEIGAKYIVREVISDYRYLMAAGGDRLAIDPSPSLTNRFDYHQDVAAGYMEYTLTTRSPLSFRAGLRYEYTGIAAGFREQAAPLPASPSYGVLAPALNLGWRLKNGKLIRLGITRRIQRPSILFLNPNVLGYDPRSILTGNPALGPEYSDNIELSYNTSIRQTTIGFSGFFRRTTHAIESVSVPTPGGDTVERTFSNIGKESTAGVNLFADVSIGQKLSLSAGADLYYMELENGIPSTGSISTDPAGHNTGWIAGGRLSGGYTFAKGWSLYLYSYYRGRQVLLQGYQSGIPYYSVTLKRDLPRKVGTIGLGAENFLGRGITVTNTIKAAGLSQSTTNLSHTLSLRIYMSFSFGKLKVEKAERPQKTIENNDLKVK